ncbi:hypothetical protein STEG23_029505, partial [Scotinomys teguina]
MADEDLQGHSKKPAPEMRPGTHGTPSAMAGDVRRKCGHPYTPLRSTSSGLLATVVTDAAVDVCV